jgi:hypothetical protein
MNKNIYSDLINYFETEKKENSKINKNFKNKNNTKNSLNKKQIKSNNINNKNSKIQKQKSNYGNKSHIPHIPCSSKNNRNISNAKMIHFSKPRQFSASKITNYSNNSNLNLNNIEDNKSIFINLFNDLCIDKNKELIENNINIKKIPKNIIRILNPLINGILKDKIRPITKNEFIFYMNDIFNSMSPIDKRLLIYTYYNKLSKNNLYKANNNNNYYYTEKTAHILRPGTPNFSMRSIHNSKSDLINKNYNYEYNYYNNDKIRKTYVINDDIDNIDFQNTKVQKNINEYLYGNNSNYYYGF